MARSAGVLWQVLVLLEGVMSGVSWQRRLEEEEELLGEMMMRRRSRRRRRRRSEELKVFPKSRRKEGTADRSVESISVQSSPSCGRDEALWCWGAERLWRGLVLTAGPLAGAWSSSHSWTAGRGLVLTAGPLGGACLMSLNS